MGNSLSGIAAVLKQFETEFCGKSTSSSWCETLVQLNGAVPYWVVGEEGRKRYVIQDFGNTHAIDNIMSLLAQELRLVDITARELAFNEHNVLTLLAALEKLLTAKALYKHLPKTDLQPLVLLIRVSARTHNVRVQLQALAVVKMIIERVGFEEANEASKPQNQLKREMAAKETFTTACGIDAIVESVAILHARCHPVLADALCRILVSILGSHQDTTSFETLQWLLVALEPLHSLLWEWTRSTYARLRVSACGLMRAIFLESDAAQAPLIQQTAIEWGALLWHLYFAVAPATGDAEFSKDSLQCNPQLPATRDLVDVTKDVPAVPEKRFWHALAREASREMVALICTRNKAASAIVQRVLPSGFKAIQQSQALKVDDVSPLHDAVFSSPSAFSTALDSLTSSGAPFCLFDEVPAVVVGLCTAKSLWWDPHTGAIARTAAHRACLANKVRTSWFDLMPTAGVIWPVVGASAPEKTEMVDEAHLVTEHRGAGPDKAKSKWKSTRQLVARSNASWSIQTAGKDWAAVFSTLLSSCIMTPNFVWSQACLRELRRALWIEIANLDITRRLMKQSSAHASKAFVAPGKLLSALGSGSGATDVSASASTGKTSRKAGWCIMAASEIWYGSEHIDFRDSSMLIPDTRGQPLDRIKNPHGKLAHPIALQKWDYDLFEVPYPSLRDMLNVSGVYIGPLNHIMTGTLPLINHPSLYCLPATFPLDLTGALMSEVNPRRRYILLTTLRKLAECALDEDASGLMHLSSQLSPSPEPLKSMLRVDAGGFGHGSIPESLLMLVAQCNAAIQDCPIADARSGIDMGVAQEKDEIFCVLTGNEPEGTQASSAQHISQQRIVSSLRTDSGFLRISSIASTGNRVGEAVHWARLWRQEGLSCLRHIVKIPRVAQAFSGSCIWHTVLPLLVVPGESSSTLPGGAETYEMDSGDSVPDQLQTVARDTNDGRIIACSCSDTGVRIVSGSSDGRDAELSSAHDAATIDFDIPPPLRTRGELLFDPDQNLHSTQLHMLRHRLGELAGELLLDVARSWRPFCKRLARDDAMGIFISVLMRSQQHPQMTAIVIRLLEVMLPHVPWYSAKLSGLGFFEALLLCSLAEVNGKQDMSMNISLANVLACAHTAESMIRRSGCADLCVGGHLGSHMHTQREEHECIAQHSFDSIFSDSDKLQLASTPAANGLARLLPLPLIELLDVGAEAFVEAFNSDLLCKTSLLWSSQLRGILMKELLQQAEQWNKREESRSIISVPSSLSLGIQEPLTAVTLCSAGFAIALPSTLSLCIKHPIIYPQLLDEPSVSGVYLRAYLSGCDGFEAPLQDFALRCTQQLSSEVHDFVHVHQTVVGALSAAAAHDDSTWADLTERYRRCHYRTMLHLRALCKVYTDIPGARVDVELFSTVNRLVSLSTYHLKQIERLEPEAPPPSILLSLLLPIDLISATTSALSTETPATLLNSAIVDAEHALQIRKKITGQSRVKGTTTGSPTWTHPVLSSYDTISEQAGSASCGVRLAGDSVSLLALTVELLFHAVKPRTQAQSSRKVCESMAQSGVMASLLAFVLSVRADVQPLDVDALSSQFLQVHLTDRQKRHLFLSAPIAVAVFRLCAWFAESDPGTDFFLHNAALLGPILLCSFPPWSLQQAAPLSPHAHWVPSLAACKSAIFRINVAATTVLYTLSQSFAVRPIFLASGAVLLILHAAVGGPIEPLVQRVLNPFAELGDGIGSTPTAEGAEVDTEQLDVSGLAGDSHVMSCTSYRLLAEGILRRLVDRSSPGNNSELSIADIAGSAAEAIAGSEPASPDSPVGPPLRKGSMRSFRVAAATSPSSFSVSRRTIASFSGSMSEKSIRAAAPSSAALASINHISNLLRNLLTPGAYMLLAPSMSDMVIREDSEVDNAYMKLCGGERSMLPVVRSSKPVSYASVHWGPQQLTILQDTLSNEMRSLVEGVVGMHVIEHIVYGHELAVPVHAPIGTASKSATATNPFASADLPTATTRKSPLASNPFGSAEETDLNRPIGALWWNWNLIKPNSSFPAYPAK